MKFVCERCHTKYSIADDKVRGKVLKVRCKTCTNVITVRETGATIDDLAGSDAPRDPPIARSGSFAADAGDGDTVVAPRAGRFGRAGGAGVGTLPVAALFAPGVPVAAPPPRRTVPPPAPAPAPEMDWYLAIDGAQTGPFSRGRLIDKILSASKEADVHVWNADFDGWKAPRDVAELQAEVARRRTATPVPPPPRRATSAGISPGGMPLSSAVSAHPGVDADGGHHVQHGHPTGVGLDPHLAHARGPASGHQKTNGASGAGIVGLGDLLGMDAASVATPGASLAAPYAAGVADSLVMLAPGLPSAAHPHAVPAPATTAAATQAGRRGQAKLLLGALAVVLLLCGIVSIWMFKRPAGVAVVGEPAPAKPAGTDFAGMAERLAKEEVKAEKAGASAPAVTRPPPVEAKPVVTRLEPPQKGLKGKLRRKGGLTTPPPLNPSAPVTAAGSSLTAEQREAASRFGESTGREVRLPGGGGGGARTTPAQGDISRVINNNRQGIQTCYQRALLRDSTLTHGKVTVRVSIGLSGKVKSVNLDAPAQFRALEPCIRDVMSRWAFPPSSEEYGTEFPVVLQGNQ